MESPETCLTNVLKIESLSRIPYALYRNLSSTSTISTRRAERTLRSEGHIVLGDREANALWVFQVECFGSGATGKRDDGEEEVESGECHVEGHVQAQFTEEETEGKWKTLEKRIGDEWGLTEHSSGIFLAASLATPTKTSEHSLQSPLLQLHGGRSTPATPALPNSRSGIFSPPPQSDVGSIDMAEEQLEEFPREDPLLPYQRFLTAVLSSISFNLSLHHGYTSLNICTLVSPLSLRPRINESREDKEDLLPSAPITLPDLVRPAVLVLEAYLTTAGTFLVTPHTHVQPALRRVSSTPLLNSLDDRDVFIAPWGEWGRVVPFDQEHGIGPREERWKSSVREYLEDCGILSTTSGQGSEGKSVLEEAINCGKWRRLEIWVPLKDHPNEGMGMTVKILWPEALLFLRTSEDDIDFVPPMAEEGAAEGRDGAFWKMVFDDPEYARFASGRLSHSLAAAITDKREVGAEWWDVPSAVDWAEEWMKGKEERDKVIMSKRDEKRKQQQEEEKASRGAEEDKELQRGDDFLADLTDDADIKGKLKLLDEAKRDGLFIGVGGAGVYPTPPDGGQQQQPQDPSSISSGSAPNTATSTTAATTVEMDLDWIDGSVITDSLSDPIRKQSDPLGDLGLGGGTGEADLFGGDMDDEEMFARGITEDDFAFFDNPDDMGRFEGGGGDVDMGLDVDFRGQSEMDLNMESPEIAAKEDVVGLVATPGVLGQSQMRRSQQGELKVSTESSTEGKAEPHIQTPPLSPHRAIRLLVPEYASSPMKNSHNLTPPTTVPVMKTPQRNGAPAPLTGLSETKRRMSLYSPITFATKMEMTDRKYAPGGRFFLPESTKEKEEKEQKELEKEQSITTPGLKRKRGGSMYMRSMVVEENGAPEVAEVVLGDEDAVMGGSDTGGDGETEDGGFCGYGTSSESDADDETEEGEEEPGGGAYYTSPVEAAFGGGLAHRKRKRPYEDEDKEIERSPPAADVVKRDVGVGADGGVEVDGEMAPPPWEIMVPDPTESSLVGIFSAVTLEADAISLAGLGDSEFIAVSRLVRDQVVFGTTKPLGNLVDMGGSETMVENDDEESCLLRQRRGKDEAVVEEAVKSLFGKSSVVRCTLENYVAVADAMIEPPPFLGRGVGMRHIPQPRRGGIASTLAKRPEAEAGTAVFKLPPPHAHIHRAESALEILPPALHFWETFGFAPCSGAKNVIAFCLHPDSGSMEEAADAFLERISGAYESGRYGMHVRAKLDEVVENGGWGIKERDVKGVVDAMEGFGSVIANVADEGCNIVIYVVNPFEHPSALVDVCVGFSRMKGVYERSLGGLKGNNLVLQVVQAGFVASKVGVVSAGQAEWARLAAEVYNRSVLSDGVASLEEAQRTFSPSIYLSRPPPKSIEFRLTPEPSPALLFENSVLHMAYSQSLDERWVSVGWTDNWGEIQSSEIYCLGRKNATILRPFDEVCRDIWNRTLEIIGCRKVHWRLIIVKVGQELLGDEIAIWTQLSSSCTHSLAIFSADVDSPVYLAPILPPLIPTGFSHQAATYSTPPVTTPTPGNSIVSPDQFGNAANTPGADPLPELDPDSSLVDLSDETWGVICGHRKRIPTPANPDGGGGLLGYLIKRGGPDDGDELAVLRVELLVADGRGGGKPLLREVLGWYRDLVTLAQFKGVIEMEGKGSVLPWHVAVAWKGVEAVGYLM